MTKSERYGYLVGVGSNVQPEKNVVCILRYLAQLFSPLWVSRIYYTSPFMLETPNPFLNFAVFFESNYSPQKVKACFNDIEEALGRNREDPNRRLVDRPADIDILDVIKEKEACHVLNTVEPYLYPMVNELTSLLSDIGQFEFEMEVANEKKEWRGISKYFECEVLGQRVGGKPCRVDSTFVGSFS